MTELSEDCQHITLDCALVLLGYGIAPLCNVNLDNSQGTHILLGCLRSGPLCHLILGKGRSWHIPVIAQVEKRHEGDYSHLVYSVREASRRSYVHVSRDAVKDGGGVQAALGPTERLWFLGKSRKSRNVDNRPPGHPHQPPVSRLGRSISGYTDD